MRYYADGRQYTVTTDAEPILHLGDAVQASDTIQKPAAVEAKRDEGEDAE